MKTFEVIYSSQPWRNRRFKVRGVCENDVLNPCWDNRPDDIVGKFWGEADIDGCDACTKEALRCRSESNKVKSEERLPGHPA